MGLVSSHSGTGHCQYPLSLSISLISLQLPHYPLTFWQAKWISASRSATWYVLAISFPPTFLTVLDVASMSTGVFRIVSPLATHHINVQQWECKGSWPSFMGDGLPTLCASLLLLPVQICLLKYSHIGFDNMDFVFDASNERRLLL